MKKNLLLTLILFITFTTLYSQDKEYKLNEIVVSAGRSAIQFSDLARRVAVLDSSFLHSLPSGNIIDLFKYLNSVDIRVRGAEGIQGDLGIRGGTFEQSLVLVNGMKMSDPQTGHHNLNLPLSGESIERIEILKGHGSRIFGPNAFAGAVNIITRKRNSNKLSLSSMAGQNNLYGLGFYSSIPISSFNNDLFFEKKKSDGYKHNTGFDIINFSYGSNVSFDNAAINFLFGYSDKNFGANNYYSDLFPNQTERTITKFVNLSSEIGINKIIISPKIFWRTNNDDYILDYFRPDWYHNHHITNSYGGEIQLSIANSFGISTIGGEINYDEIKSNNLGNHKRNKGGFFAEQLISPLQRLSLSLGVFAYNYSDTGWKFWPGFDAAYKFTDNANVFFSYGRAFRIPTFTELYYVSPANLGHPLLQSEETTNYELGFNFRKGFWENEASVFFKDGKNTIDWVRSSSIKPWKVENVTDLETLGAEVSFTIYPNYLNNLIPISKFSISYTYLNSDRATGLYQSRYLLDYLRHQIIGMINHKLPFGLEQSWIIIYKDRVNFKEQFTIDTQINFSIEKFYCFLRATNILNDTQFDFPGVELPGRWISAGVKYSLKRF